MTTLTPELIATLKQLSPDEREVVRDLLDNLDGEATEPDTELREELQRRWDRYQSGEDKGMLIEDFLAELNQRIEARQRR